MDFEPQRPCIFRLFENMGRIRVKSMFRLIFLWLFTCWVYSILNWSSSFSPAYRVILKPDGNNILQKTAECCAAPVSQRSWFKSRTGLNFFQVLFSTTRFSSVLSCEELLISHLNLIGLSLEKTLGSESKHSSQSVRFQILDNLFHMWSFLRLRLKTTPHQTSKQVICDHGYLLFAILRIW